VIEAKNENKEERERKRKRVGWDVLEGVFWCAVKAYGKGLAVFFSL
jgi:hypothetical protein